MTDVPRRITAFAFLIVALGARAADPPPSDRTPDVAAAYDAYSRRGFRVMISRRIEVTGPILRHLDDCLRDVVRVVPPSYLDILRDVTIWVESGEDEGGRLPATLVGKACGFYVPLDTDFPREIRRLPAESKGGVVMVADHFLKPEHRLAYASDRGWLMHEFAHALHDRILGHNHPAVLAAYQQAVDRKLYDAVETRSFEDLGQFRVDRGPAYARTSHLEYFAELSVAYFDMSSRSYPFTRDDLADLDPGGSVLMDGFWRPVKFRVVNEMLYGVTVERRSECGRRFRLFDLHPGTEREFDGWEGMSLVVTNVCGGTSLFAAKPAKDGKTWRLNATTAKPLPPSPWSLLLNASH